MPLLQGAFLGYWKSCDPKNVMLILYSQWLIPVIQNAAKYTCSLLLFFLLFAIPSTQLFASDLKTTTSSRTIVFNITAGPLVNCVTQFATQAGIFISGDARILEQKTCAGLQGSYSVKDGLTTLLINTGITFKFTDETTVIFEAADNVKKLQAVKVIANQLPSERYPDQVVERNSAGTSLFGNANLREVPFTVNVVTNVEIANRLANTLGEALVGDPAVRNDYGGTGAYPTESFNIRGFEINGGNAFLKDGMPMAGQVTQSTENIEQIEVARGPMGFRYGYLPPGGAVNLVSKRPTDESIQTFIATTDGYGSIKGHVDVGGHLANTKLGYRLNAVAEEQKLYFKPIEKHRTLLSTAFDYHFDNDSKISIFYDRNHYLGGPGVFHYASPDIQGNEIKGIDPNVYWGQKFLDDNDFLTQTTSLKIETPLTESLVFTSITGIYAWDAYYSDVYQDVNTVQPNGDFTPILSKAKYQARNFNNTTYLTQKVDGKTISHSLTTGFSIGDSNWYEMDDNFSSALSNCTSSFFRYVACEDIASEPHGSYHQTDDEQQSGFFVSDEMRFNEKWLLLIAARYSNLELHNQTQDTQTSAIDPTFGLMYLLNDTLSIYTSYGTGLEDGRVIPRSTGYNNAGEQLPIKESKQLELGIKSDLNDGRLILDASLFSISKTGEYGDENDNLRSGGEQVHMGIEIRATGKVSDEFTIITGVQRLKPVFKGKSPNKGHAPQNVPSVNFTFYGDYRIDNLPGLYLIGGIYYTGEREISVPNIPAKAPAYTRLDLGLRYETTLADHYVISRLSVDNLTNEHYYNSGWYKLYEFGTPRLLNASIEVKF